MKQFVFILAMAMTPTLMAQAAYDKTLAAFDNEEKQVDVLKEYLAIKDALVADDFDQVQKTATLMTKRFEDYVKELQAPRKVIITLNKLVYAEDISSQRQQFAALSRQVYQSLKDEDLEKNFFWKRCPMALDGAGAGWISLEQQIENPYFDKESHACGTIEEAATK